MTTKEEATKFITNMPTGLLVCENNGNIHDWHTKTSVYRYNESLILRIEQAKEVKIIRIDETPMIIVELDNLTLRITQYLESTKKHIDEFIGL